jgi:hypothetical protein
MVLDVRCSSIADLPSGRRNTHLHLFGNIFPNLVCVKKKISLQKRKRTVGLSECDEAGSEFIISAGAVRKLADK